MQPILSKSTLANISEYLSIIRGDITTLYTWNANISRLSELEVFTDKELDQVMAMEPYTLTFALKDRIGQIMRDTYLSDKDRFNQMAKWVISDWGGVIGLKESSVPELVAGVLEEEKPPFSRISSSSKIAAYYDPNQYAIYDSRVAFSLNWLILSRGSETDLFFPMPKGRNSKLSAFDIEVLIRLKRIDQYRIDRIEQLNNRLFISTLDKKNYIPAKAAYFEFNKVLKEISSRVWQDDTDKALFKTGMLLFSIADTLVFKEITDSTTIQIKHL